MKPKHEMNQVDKGIIHGPFIVWGISFDGTPGVFPGSIFRVVDDLPGYYVSAIGQVVNTLSGANRVKKTYVDQHGNIRVRVYVKNNPRSHSKTSRRVDHMVATAFCHREAEAHILMLMDGDKSNVRASNLCWLSHGDKATLCKQISTKRYQLDQLNERTKLL